MGAKYAKPLLLIAIRFLLTLLIFGFSLHAASASESLFPANKVGNDSGPEGTYYELGTIFRAT